MIIAVDTEFSRERTYYPMLSLIQIKMQHEHDVRIYDILNPQCNIQEVRTLLMDDSIIKIFHAARQDIEAVHHKFRFIMRNIFDTQIAAKILGFGTEIGYATTVKEFCNTEIQKDRLIQFSKWHKRPLTEEQLAYAKQDVLYLHQIYQKMHEVAERDNRGPLLLQEIHNSCNSLSREELYKFNPLATWNKVKYKSIAPIHLSKLRELFIFREVIASNRNIVRNRIATNDELLRLVKEKDVNIIDKMPNFVDRKRLLQIIDS